MQVIPEAATALLEVCQDQPVVVWLVRIKDAILGDEPQWRWTLPRKSKFPEPSVAAVARSAAQHLNNGTGLLLLTRYRKGFPSHTGCWVSNSVQVYCAWSTDTSEPSLLRRQNKATRFAELSYRADAPRLWRIYDNATGRAVGPQYKSEQELLADLERFAGTFGAGQGNKE